MSDEWDCHRGLIRLLLYTVSARSSCFCPTLLFLYAPKLAHGLQSAAIAAEVDAASDHDNDERQTHVKSRAQDYVAPSSILYPTHTPQCHPFDTYPLLAPLSCTTLAYTTRAY